MYDNDTMCMNFGCKVTHFYRICFRFAYFYYFKLILAYNMKACIVYITPNCNTHPHNYCHIVSKTNF